MDAQWHIRQAEELLEVRTAYYNGGQTVREEPPTERNVQRAEAHAALAGAIIARETLDLLRGQ